MGKMVSVAWCYHPAGEPVTIVLGAGGAWSWRFRCCGAVIVAFSAPGARQGQSAARRQWPTWPHADEVDEIDLVHGDCGDP